jgi:hypothetical protein
MLITTQTPLKGGSFEGVPADLLGLKDVSVSGWQLLFGARFASNDFDLTTPTPYGNNCAWMIGAGPGFVGGPAQILKTVLSSQSADTIDTSYVLSFSYTSATLWTAATRGPYDYCTLEVMYNGATLSSIIIDHGMEEWQDVSASVPASRARIADTNIVFVLDCSELRSNRVGGVVDLYVDNVSLSYKTTGECAVE